MNGRPKNLKEVSQLLGDNVAFEIVIGDFLDQFRLRPTPEALAEAPLQGSPLQDSWLAALAEHISTQNKWTVPTWCGGHRLEAEHVPNGINHPKLIELLREETPPAFLRRNILMSENALTRV